MNKTLKITICIILIIFTICTVCFSIFFINFPTKYKKEVINFSQKYNLDTNLVFALIKTESGFNEKSVSKSNARGLMQLLPTTANEIAKKLNIIYSDELLFLPIINIEFGCFYLREMLNKFDGNVTNSLSAYNAGASNVLKWQQSQNLNKSETLIDIPFNETKNYVNKIMIYKKYYKIRNFFNF